MHFWPIFHFWILRKVRRKFGGKISEKFKFFDENLRSKINFFSFPFKSALKYVYGDASELQIRTDPRIRNFSALKRIQKKSNFRPAEIRPKFGGNSAKFGRNTFVKSSGQFGVIPSTVLMQYPPERNLPKMFTKI